jgi:hypothetical protein
MFIVAFNIDPPYKSAYGLTSVPPPAKPNRSGALLLIIIGTNLIKKKEGTLSYYIPSFLILFINSTLS